MKTRAAFTLMEVMIATAMAVFMVSIGTSGIWAFRKAIVRAVQVSAEAQAISRTLMLNGAVADGLVTGPLATTLFSDTGDKNPLPRNWPSLSYNVGAKTLTISTSSKKIDYSGRFSASGIKGYTLTEVVKFEVMGNR